MWDFILSSLFSIKRVWMPSCYDMHEQSAAGKLHIAQEETTYPHILWNYKGQNCCSKKLQPKRCKIDILQRIPYMSCTMTLAPMDIKAGLNHSDPVFLLTAITMQLHPALQGTGQPLTTIMPVHGALFNQVELINLNSKTAIQKIRCTGIVGKNAGAHNHSEWNKTSKKSPSAQWCQWTYHLSYHIPPAPLLATVNNKDL